MGDKTKISWADATWNPISGCSKVSIGCKHCYAEALTYRFGGDFSRIILHPDRVDQPLRWRKPRRIFVNSMSDIFHADVPTGFIIDLFEMMGACQHHEFLVLTKRPERVESVLYGQEGNHYLGGGDWYRNILMGFSAEDQASFDKRWACFLGGEHIAWSYAMRVWVSLEPLLGPVDLRAAIGRDKSTLEWIVVGGESGPHARPMHVEWLRAIVEQCQAANVKVWVKQDSHRLPGQQGRIPTALWRIKNYPDSERSRREGD